MSTQLTISGTETPVIAPSKHYRLTPAQRDILRHIGEHGAIRSVEAGEIIHEHSTTSRWRGRPEWRRPYASSDGSEAMKRLARQGLVRRDPEKPGRWLAP